MRNGFGCDHGRDGVHEPHRRGLQAGRVVVTVAPEQLQVERVVGLTLHLHPVAALTRRLRPVPGEIVVQPSGVLEHHDGATSVMPCTSNRSAAAVPASMVPLAMSKVSVASSRS